MNKCGDNLESVNIILNLDYLLEKCSWCIKNNFNNYVRLCKYIEQIIHLSDNNFVSLISNYYLYEIIMQHSNMTQVHPVCNLYCFILLYYYLNILQLKFIKALLLFLKWYNNKMFYKSCYINKIIICTRSKKARKIYTYLENCIEISRYLVKIIKI